MAVKSVDWNGRYEKVLAMVKDGVDITKAISFAGHTVNTGKFYSKISEEQKLELKKYKMIFVNNEDFLKKEIE